ncbi:hypothetical protein PANDA_004058 [Ailuropoda melanoleuca]|uniref:EGF-like domain-containing protein n=1 Tax=Ailuropoda melanoleuca TaxID=9646 RepID=D2H320_AILME|nr:hypothetical protein PANDA_004058 [Ailuropoda melanoleuca]
MPTYVGPVNPTCENKVPYSFHNSYPSTTIAITNNTTTLRMFLRFPDCIEQFLAFYFAQIHVSNYLQRINKLPTYKCLGRFTLQVSVGQMHHWSLPALASRNKRAEMRIYTCLLGFLLKTLEEPTSALVEEIGTQELLPNCQQLNCQYKCAMVRNSTRCYCEDGFEVKEDGRSCRDQDECAIYGACSQTCINSYGSYACSCVEGYIMQPDNRSCKAKNEPTDRLPMLLIANSETIEVFYLNGSKMATLSSVNGNEIHTLDFIYNEDMICWIESRESSNQLKCIQITKTGRLTDEWAINILQSFHNVQQMAIDWLTRNLYFVDHVSDRIFVCNYNGSVCVTLIDLELHNPKAIAVDPIAGCNEGIKDDDVIYTLTELGV